VQLRKERYSNVTEYLAGRSIRNQLVALIREKSEGSKPDGGEAAASLDDDANWQPA